jgi:hypothetical protein
VYIASSLICGIPVAATYAYSIMKVSQNDFRNIDEKGNVIKPE